MDHSECKNIIEETCGPSADFRNSNFHSKELQSINKKKKRSQASRLKRKIKRQQEAIAKFQKKQGIQWFLKNAAFYYVKSFLNFLFIFLSITMNKKKIFNYKKCMQRVLRIRQYFCVQSYSPTQICNFSTVVQLIIEAN